jgi:hypothetical protein
MKSMSQSTIINGFKTCGIFPFDPSIVLERCEQPTPLPLSDNDGIERCEQPSPLPLSDNDGIEFSTEEEVQFQRRFDENYYLLDD